MAYFNIIVTYFLKFADSFGYSWFLCMLLAFTLIFIHRIIKSSLYGTMAVPDVYKSGPLIPVLTEKKELGLNSV